MYDCVIGIAHWADGLAGQRVVREYKSQEVDLTWMRANWHSTVGSHVEDVHEHRMVGRSVLGTIRVPICRTCMRSSVVRFRRAETCHRIAMVALWLLVAGLPYFMYRCLSSYFRMPPTSGLAWLVLSGLSALGIAVCFMVWMAHDREPLRTLLFNLCDLPTGMSRTDLSLDQYKRVS